MWPLPNITTNLNHYFQGTSSGGPFSLQGTFSLLWRVFYLYGRSLSPFKVGFSTPQWEFFSSSFFFQPPPSPPLPTTVFCTSIIFLPRNELVRTIVAILKPLEVYYGTILYSNMLHESFIIQQCYTHIFYGLFLGHELLLGMCRSIRNKKKEGKPEVCVNLRRKNRKERKSITQSRFLCNMGI